MNIEDFDFHLPQELIAQTPLPNRTSSKLMTLDRTSKAIGHHQFTDLIDFLHPGDTLVFNNTRVIPARLYGLKHGTGAKVEILLLKSLGEDRWEALVRPGKRVKAGTTLYFGADEIDQADLIADVEQEQEQGIRILRFRYRGIFNEILDRLGTMPLPPYIKQQLKDKDRYQTVYAKQQGSAAAPTAGLHFTKSYMRQLQEKGVRLAFLTLHVGLGTFRPVSTEKVEDHVMHEEFFELPQETADILEQTRKEGGRIIAVGTTTVRTLETAIRVTKGTFRACSGWTDIFIYPGFNFRSVQAIFTNFHLPKSTLIMMISAFAGRETILEAYEEAIAHQYRFFSFGDAMFIY